MDEIRSEETRLNIHRKAINFQREGDYDCAEKTYRDASIIIFPEYFRKHLHKDLFTYIACSNDRVIATVFLYVSEKPANPHNIRGQMGEVLNVVTEPDFRRQGIAEKLINMMLDDAKVMELSTVKPDATEMGKPVYQKVGFKPEMSKYTAMIYEI